MNSLRWRLRLQRARVSCAVDTALALDTKRNCTFSARRAVESLRALSALRKHCDTAHRTRVQRESASDLAQLVALIAGSTVCSLERHTARIRSLLSCAAALIAVFALPLQSEPSASLAIALEQLCLVLLASPTRSYLLVEEKQHWRSTGAGALEFADSVALLLCARLSFGFSFTFSFSSSLSFSLSLSSCFDTLYRLLLALRCFAVKSFTQQLQVAVIDPQSISSQSAGLDQLNLCFLVYC